MTAPDDARKEGEIAASFGRETAIIEAAARALFEVDETASLDETELARASWVVATVTPLIRAAALANEREEIARQARNYAGHYKEGSDGRNTFIMLAEWIEARKEPADELDRHTLMGPPRDFNEL
jgi:hypothetical protein